MNSLDDGFDLVGGLLSGWAVEDLLLGSEAFIEESEGGGRVGLGSEDNCSLGQIEGEL